MKIRFIRTLSTTRAVFRRGHEYEVEDAEAKQYLTASVAEQVTAAATRGQEKPKRQPTAAEKAAPTN